MHLQCIWLQLLFFLQKLFAHHQHKVLLLPNFGYRFLHMSGSDVSLIGKPLGDLKVHNLQLGNLDHALIEEFIYGIAKSDSIEKIQ